MDLFEPQDLKEGRQRWEADEQKLLAQDLACAQHKGNQELLPSVCVPGSWYMLLLVSIMPPSSHLDENISRST